MYSKAIGERTHQEEQRMEALSVARETCHQAGVAWAAQTTRLDVLHRLAMGLAGAFVAGATASEQHRP